MMRNVELTGSRGAEKTSARATASVRLRIALGKLALAGGAAAFLWVGHAHYPIQRWLVWRIAAAWVVCGVWAFACLVSGRRVLSAFGLRSMPLLEDLAMSFAAGVVLFFLGLFGAGIAGQLEPWFAILWPICLIATGPRSTGRLVVRMGARALRQPIARSELLASLFGLFGLAMVYFTILTPLNLSFDARWYHLPIAEHFVAQHGIGPFREGWYLGAYPHLTSILYAWVFLLPATTLFDRTLFASHIEFFFFLATLACLPLMMRRLIGKPAPRGSWAAMFLFPSILLYDGSLCGGADHVLAFFAIPVYLSLARVVRRFEVRRCVLLALALSGALLTKYQAVYLLLPSVFVVALAALRGATPRRTVVLGAACAMATGLALTAPHWLANAIWYHDPLYPMLHGLLPSRPFTPDALSKLDIFLATDLFRPHGTLVEKLAEAVRVVVSFSFEPHDWATYHGSTPVFGSLFTIAMFALFALRAPGPIATAAAMVASGVACWFLTSHQDRYLQCLVPWMVAVTVAAARRIWLEMPPLRAWLALPLAVQLIWGGDVYFIPANDDSYELDRPSPVKSAADLIASGYRGQYEQRLHPFPEWEEVGAVLARGAKVLLHERYLHLGLSTMSASDLPGWQGGISYEDTKAPRDIYHLLRSMGITHVLWETGVSHEQATFEADAAFFWFAARFLVEPRTIGKWTVARLPEVAPNAGLPPASERFDCHKGAALDKKLEVVLAGPECANLLSDAGLERVAARGVAAIWLRQPM